MLILPAQFSLSSLYLLFSVRAHCLAITCMMITLKRSHSISFQGRPSQIGKSRETPGQLISFFGELQIFVLEISKFLHLMHCYVIITQHFFFPIIISNTYKLCEEDEDLIAKLNESSYLLKSQFRACIIISCGKMINISNFFGDVLSQINLCSKSMRYKTTK